MKVFTKRPESFVCEVCHTKVIGNGYTNHCPQCLHSKHVDNNPGDRANPCGGVMKPIQIIVKGGEPHDVVQECVRCGYVHVNKLSAHDSVEAIISVTRAYANKVAKGA